MKTDLKESEGAQHIHIVKQLGLFIFPQIEKLAIALFFVKTNYVLTISLYFYGKQHLIIPIVLKINGYFLTSQKVSKRNC